MRDVMASSLFCQISVRSPLHARVKAWKMNRAVRVLTLDLELPYNLGRVRCHFHDARALVFQIEWCRRVNEHIAVRKLLDRSSPKRVREGIGPANIGGHVGFIHVVNNRTAVAGWLPARAANVTSRIKHAIVAVVENSQLENS